MDFAYPFIPKSNAKLKPGHFWPIRILNGKYACGIVLDVPKGGERYNTRNFYVGLLNWVGDSKPTVSSLETSPLSILDQGQAHIKTILASNEAIEGWLDLIKNQLQMDLMVNCQVYNEFSKVLKGYEVVRKATFEDHRNLKTRSTWGYEVINDLANKLLSTK